MQQSEAESTASQRQETNSRVNGFARWLKGFVAESIKRQVFRTTLAIGLLTCVVKVASVGRESVLAWRFGTNDALDAFLIAFVIPSFIINIVAGSFNSSLIPTYLHVREREGVSAAQKLFSGATGWSFVFLLIATLVTLSAAPLYLPLLGSGFTAGKLRLTFYLLCVLAPIILLNGVTAIWSAALNATGHFAIAAISPVITPLVSIAFLLLFRTLGIFALAGGIVGGAALELAVLGWAIKRRGFGLRPIWNPRDANLRAVACQYAPMVAGALLMSGTNLVDQSMAAMLPAGSVARINYGNKVISFIRYREQPGHGAASAFFKYERAAGLEVLAEDFGVEKVMALWDRLLDEVVKEKDD